MYKRLDVFQGRSCCSDYPISFHYVKGEQMAELDFFYHQTNPENETLPVCLPIQRLTFYNAATSQRNNSMD